MKKYLFITFKEKEDLKTSFNRLIDKGIDVFDIFSPYPDEDLAKLISKKDSPLLGIVLVAGILGVFVALIFQIFTTAIDYKTVVGGKSPFYIQAFIPIMFEVMVLLASLTAVFGMLFALNKLPLFSHPLHQTKNGKKVFQDCYAIGIVIKDITIKEIEEILEGVSREGIEIVEYEQEKIKTEDVARATISLIIVTFVAAIAFYSIIKIFPLISPVKDIIYQPRVRVYDKSEILKNGLAVAYPPKESVFTTQEIFDLTNQDANTIINPIPFDEEHLLKGKEKFSIYCAVCHGVTGDGNNFLGPNYKAKPANLLSKTIAEKSDGELFYVIMKGKNAMPSYENDLSNEDVFSILNYIKVLRRAQDATEDDYKKAIGEKK